MSIPIDSWWRGAALYQIYPLSFADSNGDGWGDLPGITARLDYVASLGVDGIWLSPFYEGDYADFGYDTTNHKAVDPRCGTLADFDTLLERAHRLGLKVVIDQVYTYTSKAHPWFIESRSQRGGPKDGWYLWAEAKPDGTPPNNWISIFGGPAWEWDLARRQYYMTHFLPEMPHLRVQNPAVQDALLDIGRFWLDRGVDGFRLDVINLAMVDDELRDNPPSGEKSLVMPIEAQQCLYSANRPENLAFVGRIRRLADERPGRFLMGEVAGVQPMDAAKEYTAGSEHLHSAYHVLGAGRTPLSAAGLQRELGAWTQRHDGWPTWSFSNHDVVRGVSRCGGENPPPELARLLLAILAASRGTILIYQGDELGLPDGDVPQAELRDPATRRFYPDYLQRDGARTPMPWRASAPNAGFTTGAAWLPIGRGHAGLAVDAQERHSDSTLAATRQVLALRRREPALRTGDLEFISLPERLLGLERIDASRRIACFFNVSRHPASFTWLPASRATKLVEHGCTSTGDRVTLDPWGFCLLGYEKN